MFDLVDGSANVAVLFSLKKMVHMLSSSWDADRPAFIFHQNLEQTETENSQDKSQKPFTLSSQTPDGNSDI